MKALIYHGPETLEFGDAPKPEPGEGEVLVRVEAVGICGSDMHAYLGHDERRPAPLILGHEAAGVIASGAREGARVTINPLVTCGACAHCQKGAENLCENRQIISMPPREGAFGEYVAIPEENLIPIPDDISFLKAALIEPIACGWNAARQAKARSRADFDGASALIFGGGAIGVGAALSLKAAGCANITLIEPHAARRKYLGEHIGLEAITPEELAPDALFDFAIDGVGIRATREEASRLVSPGGAIFHIGLGGGEDGLDIRRMTLYEIAFYGCYTYTKQDFRDTAQALFAGRLGALDWVETRPLDEGAAAFADLRAQRVTPPKIILEP